MTNAQAILTALGDPTRQAILDLLLEGPQPVGELPRCCRSAGRRSPSTSRCSRRSGSWWTGRRGPDGSTAWTRPDWPRSAPTSTGSGRRPWSRSPSTPKSRADEQPTSKERGPMTQQTIQPVRVSVSVGVDQKRCLRGLHRRDDVVVAGRPPHRRGADRAGRRRAVRGRPLVHQAHRRLRDRDRRGHGVRPAARLHRHLADRRRLGLPRRPGDDHRGAVHARPTTAAPWSSWSTATSRRTAPTPPRCRRPSRAPDAWGGDARSTTREVAEAA